MNKKDKDNKEESMKEIIDAFNNVIIAANKIGINLEDLLKNTDEKWIPRDGEDYWYYDKDIERICEVSWCDDNHDNIRLKNKVIFKTEAEAQRYADYMKAKEECSYEFSKEEWENCINKYYIFYDHAYEELNISSNCTCQIMERTYFKTKDQAQEFIDKYKSEILEFEFGIKED